MWTIRETSFKASIIFAFLKINGHSIKQIYDQNFLYRSLTPKTGVRGNLPRPKKPFKNAVGPNKANLDKLRHGLNPIFIVTRI